MRKTPTRFMNELSRSKIVLSTHYQIYSVSQALRDYIRKNNCKNLLYISHPLSLKGSKIEDNSFFESSVGEEIVGKKMAKRKDTNILISSFYDSMLTFFWALRIGRSDLFIGIDNLNAIVGIMLKKSGLVKKVVYYTIDYFPTRFENKILNLVYHWIDKLCVENADEIWNVSGKMVSAREKNGIVSKNQYTVPIGIWYKNAPRKEFSEIDKKKLIFVGHLLEHMGVDLVVAAMPQILKEIPGVKLEIIGGGQEEENLKKLSKKLEMDKHIKFWGWVRNRNKLEEIMSDGAVGLATFNTEILDEKVKNADPGKIKDYMLLGMPVIATNALSTGPEIEKLRCGLIIDYKISDLTRAVIQLLGSEKLLKEYRENALKYVLQFDYNRIFEKNLRRIINKQ